MQFGIRLHDAAPGTLEERIDAVRAQGFACAHVALSKLCGPQGTFSPGTAAWLRRAFSGLDVAVLGCYLSPAREGYEKANRTRYVEHLRLAAWLGGCVVGTESDHIGDAYMPEIDHSDAALVTLIKSLKPIVDAAEKLGAILALEPVYTHIVSTPERARAVLDAIDSPNLRIILDPVNLLHPENLARRASVIDEALSLLGSATAVVHLKDYRVENGRMIPMAAGQGEMDYQPILRYFEAHQPHIQATLENTAPENAAQALTFLRGELKKANAVL